MNYFYMSVLLFVMGSHGCGLYACDNLNANVGAGKRFGCYVNDQGITALPSNCGKPYAYGLAPDWPTKTGVSLTLYDNDKHDPKKLMELKYSSLDHFCASKVVPKHIKKEVIKTVIKL